MPASSLELAKSFATLRDDAGTARLQHQQLVLVGWSDRAKRMMGHSFVQETVAAGFVHEILDPGYRGPSFIAPWDREFERLCKPQNQSEGLSVGEFGLLAAAQVDWLAKVTPDDVSGGRLILAEMSRGSVRTWEECSLQDDRASERAV